MQSQVESRCNRSRVREHSRKLKRCCWNFSCAEYSPTYYEGTPFEHFSFFRCFRRVVLSNSTFAWWAAYLSDAEQVYAPRTTQQAQFSFTGFQGVDLHMREARYIEVPVA